MIGTADTMGGAARQSWILGHELKSKGYKVRWLVRTKKSNKSYVHGFFNHWQTNFAHLRNFLLSNDLDSGLEKEIFPGKKVLIQLERTTGYRPYPEGKLIAVIHD